MLELGGIIGLRVGLKQSTSMELGELGLVTIVPSLSSIKFYLCLSTFLVT
jgi:hypothetical protein